jgi:hypothetical protein
METWCLNLALVWGTVRLSCRTLWLGNKEQLHSTTFWKLFSKSVDKHIKGMYRYEAVLAPDWLHCSWEVRLTVKIHQTTISVREQKNDYKSGEKYNQTCYNSISCHCMGPGTDSVAINSETHCEWYLSHNANISSSKFDVGIWMESMCVINIAPVKQLRMNRLKMHW